MKFEKAYVEQFYLEDGRRAERHTTTDDNGNEVVELFAEEPRPFKLENRVVREYKQVVARETREQVKDGVISKQQILSREPDLPLQIRSHIATADHAKIVDGDYVRKDEIEKLITEGVVAGVSALIELSPQPQPQPLRAMSQVETAVAAGKWNVWINVGLVILVVAQLAFMFYVLK